MVGTQAAFRHIPYDWAKAADLKPLLHEAHAHGALVICSSEGGLFEYGSDDEEENLKTLRECVEVLAVIGSVTRADEPAKLLHQTSAAAIQFRGLPVFRDLMQKAGWNVTRVMEPMQRPVCAHRIALAVTGYGVISDTPSPR